MPQISIIVPCYNVEEYLEKCLDSLINQTFKDIEIICIDDGSPDNCLKILKIYEKKDKRIKVFTQENQGAGGARNKGINEAKSPFLMFCDPDDWYELDMCELMYKAMQSGADFAVCSHSIVKEGSQTTVKLGNKKIFNQNSVIKEGSQTTKFKKTFNLDGLWELNQKTRRICTYPVVWNKIFRMDILKRYNIFFPLGKGPGEDNEFSWKYLAVSRKVFGINKSLYNYLTRKNSTMNSKETLPNGASRRAMIFVGNFINFVVDNNLLEENFWAFQCLENTISSILPRCNSKKEQLQVLEEGRKSLLKLISRTSILRACANRNYEGILDAFRQKYGNDKF